MTGKLLQLARDGAGIIDAADGNVYGFVIDMLPERLPAEEFVRLEGHRVTFEVIEETATSVQLVTVADPT